MNVTAKSVDRFELLVRSYLIWVILSVRYSWLICVLPLFQQYFRHIGLVRERVDELNLS